MRGGGLSRGLGGVFCWGGGGRGGGGGGGGRAGGCAGGGGGGAGAPDAGGDGDEHGAVDALDGPKVVGGHEGEVLGLDAERGHRGPSGVGDGDRVALAALHGRARGVEALGQGERALAVGALEVDV